VILQQFQINGAQASGSEEKSTTAVVATCGAPQVRSLELRRFRQSLIYGVEFHFETVDPDTTYAWTGLDCSIAQNLQAVGNTCGVQQKTTMPHWGAAYNVIRKNKHRLKNIPLVLGLHVEITMDKNT
jgi:hypothetical protein